MNITDLARRLRTNTEELRRALPELGFDIGSKALKVPDRDVGRIMNGWREYKKRQYLQKKKAEQQARLERKEAVKSGDAKAVSVPDVISVRDFAELLNLPIAKVMQELMRAGILASLNENLDYDTAAIVAEDLGFITEREDASSSNHDDEGVDKLEEVLEASDVKDKRPPVIVVMGHVDHGKTLLLDTIRDANVVDGEAGGITQHIGAYQVVWESKESGEKRPITFIDTPGHEAFTVMRSRGAKVADIAILVIAADDGIQPQTREAIDIIKASGMPFVVAINKIDKETADVDRIKGALTEFGMIPEDYGGETICVPVSAKKNQNIDQLLDTLLLLDDMHAEKIVADSDRLALGTIIESHIDKGQGPVATVLVQMGTLKSGDVLGVRGTHFGKVRAMQTWDGKQINEAPPSTPVRILGFKAAPSVGDILEVPEDVKELEKLRAQPGGKIGASEITVTSKKASSEDTEGERVDFNLIIKADVLGSLEAIIGMIESIDNPYVQVKIVKRGLGNVTDAEILEAEATGAYVAAFNTNLTKTAEQLARDKDVAFGQYSVIYKLFEYVVDRLKELMPSETVYTELGTVEVLAVFRKLDKGMIIGGRVNKGVAQLGATVRVVRGEEILGEGIIKTLQAGKADVKEVQQGAECGIEFEGKTKIEAGDILEIYTEEEKERTLEVHGANR